jgi:hypothetical protein
VIDERTALIPSVSRNYQLLQKGETFVSRRIVKTRDAFDMRLLLAEGAVLDEILKAHLNDLIMWRELDAEQIKERIHSEALPGRAQIRATGRGLQQSRSRGNSKAREQRLEPCLMNGCRRRTGHLVDWAATLRKEAQRSPILRSDDLARRYGIVESAVGNALRRQERRGLVEHVSNKVSSISWPMTFPHMNLLEF